MTSAHWRGRSCTAWIDNIKMWTGLPVEESTRMTENRDKWRKYVHGVANARIENGQGTEQNMLWTIIITQMLSTKGKKSCATIIEDTVPILMWHHKGMHRGHSTESPLFKSLILQ